MMNVAAYGKKASSYAERSLLELDDGRGKYRVIFERRGIAFSGDDDEQAVCDVVSPSSERRQFGPASKLDELRADFEKVRRDVDRLSADLLELAGDVGRLAARLAIGLTGLFAPGIVLAAAVYLTFCRRQ